VRSHLDCGIPGRTHQGRLRGRARIWPPNDPGSHYAAENLLAEPATRYFGDGYKRAVRQIRNIDLNSETGKVGALVTIAEQDSASIAEGIGAAYRPCLTVIDDIVIMAQLAQVLVYASDNLSRDQTGTLWLRHFVGRASALWSCSRSGRPLSARNPTARPAEPRSASSRRCWPCHRSWPADRRRAHQRAELAVGFSSSTSLSALPLRAGPVAHA
jgi:hypothetical protein